jgi:hypothetical protein
MLRSRAKAAIVRWRSRRPRRTSIGREVRHVHTGAAAPARGLADLRVETAGPNLPLRDAAAGALQQSLDVGRHPLREQGDGRANQQDDQRKQEDSPDYYGVPKVTRTWCVRPSSTSGIAVASALAPSRVTHRTPRHACSGLRTETSYRVF